MIIAHFAIMRLKHWNICFGGVKGTEFLDRYKIELDLSMLLGLDLSEMLFGSKEGSTCNCELLNTLLIFVKY